MEYTTIHGAQVSRIGLGTWAIGGSEWGAVSESDAVGVCLSALKRGINLIDTAPIYGRGRAEELVGKAMRLHGRREDFYIATKCGLQWDDPSKPGAVITNSTPERIERELYDSLRRLQTDYIDLYQVHWPDPLVPMQKTAALMARFLEKGKIRAIGVSNFSISQMDAFGQEAPIHSCQPPLNLFERAAQTEVLPYCRERGIAVLTWSSLCRSLLTGKLTGQTHFPPSDIRAYDPKFQPPRLGQYLAAVARLDGFAEQHYGKTVLELAVRWVLDQPGVSVALWGAKRPEQLQAVDGVLRWRLHERALASIDQILRDTIKDPVGAEYLTPESRESGESGPSA